MSKKNDKTQSITVQQIHSVNLKDLIRSSKGQFFTIIFKKKQGEERVMNAKLGVKKNLKGGKNTVEGDSRPYLVVWDAQKRAYRTVNLATARQIKIKGNIYDIVNS